MDEIPELKKPKIDKSIDELEKLIAVQNKEFFAHRDYVKSKLVKSNWIQILEVNKQKIPKTDDEVTLQKYFPMSSYIKQITFCVET